MVKAITEVENPATERNATDTTGSKAGRPQRKQATLNWSAKGKKPELENFKMKVRYIFMTKMYNIVDAGKVPTIKTG